MGNLNNETIEYMADNDHVVIKRHFDGYDGGRTLNTEGFTPSKIKAGHVVIKKDNDFKPMPVNGDKYATLPEGYEYAGVVVASVLTKKPFVGILTQGTVNHKAAPYDLETILADVKTACPLIEFRAD